ncbi:hypothetical protein ACQPW1_18780 [Nocardia sp. CA-128927]|uniref:hypothetical protein n=1 Tax=Nocardia sp. CA-128927 TaxID=3239975 RepID=UPI003D98F33E
MRRPPTPRYVLILETTVLIMIAIGFVLVRLSVKISGGHMTNYWTAGAVLAGLAAIWAHYSARRARAVLEPPDADNPVTDP